MEETRQAKQRPPRRKQKQDKGRDWFLFVTLSQCISCFFVLLLLFFCGRGNSARAEGLRADWALLLSRSWTVEDAKDAVDVLREFWTPQSETVAVMAQPDEATTTQPPAEARAAKEPDIKAETQPAAKAAAKNTSFSPSAVTVPITRPVEGGRYSSYFGYRNNPITHKYAFHTGLDIAVPTGTAIRAAYGGTVRLVGEDGRSGKYVTISHDDGYETFYCHCSETLVTEGTVVRAGEAVAKVGATGWATGPHLHFEIRKNGTKLDPLQILERDA